MTKYEVFHCDRCSEEILVSEGGRKPTHIEISYGKDIEVYDLCEDCHSSLTFWLDCQKEIDAFIEDLARKQAEVPSQ